MHDAVRKTLGHYEAFWPSRVIDLVTWDEGPLRAAFPDFRVARVRPHDVSDPWIFASLGSSIVDCGSGPRHEFVLTAPADSSRFVETVALAFYFHATRFRLGVGSIVSIGRPWADESICDRLLVSLPYPFGPALEWTSNGVRVLWLLPISAAEERFALTHGVEALERRLEEKRVDAVAVRRASVV